MNAPVPFPASNRPRRTILFFLLLMLSNLTAQAQNNWTGNTNRNWNTAGNWSAGIPTATSDVVIPSAPANQPVLSTTATAKSVEVQAGASLSISSAGSLTLNGSKPIPIGVLNFTCTFLNDGSVNNSGQVVIGSSATASVGELGIRNNGTFANNTGGSIAIDRTTSTGLFNVNGSFSNSATITIGAVASVGEQGILNQATFANNTGGSITIDQISLTGLVNNRSFTNSAQITIRAGRTGILNGATNSTFQNTGCAALINIVADAYILNIGTFSNGGTIIENATGNSSISSNAGLVQNLNGGTFTITGTNTGLITTISGSLPVITATPSLTITQGQSTTLTASGALSYSWSTGETTPAITVSATGPYSVTGTIGGCSSKATVGVTVVPTFTVSNPAICPGQFVNLGNYVSNKSPITGDLTYYTSQANAQAGTNALISGLVGPVNVPVTYYVRYDAAGSFSIQPIMVTLKPALPAPPVLTQDGHAYTGGVSSLTVAQNSESVALAVPGCDGSVAWSGPNNFISFNSTISVPTSTTGSFTYSASCSSETACFSGSSQATVTVNAATVAPTITLGTPGPICQGNTVLIIPYTATTGNPTAYTVSGMGITGNGTLSGLSGNLTASLTSGFTGTFSVVVQTSQGQSSSATPGMVAVNAAPVASIMATPSLTVCQGASVTLTASGAADGPGTAYQWNNGQITQTIVVNTNDPSGNPGLGGGYSGPAGPQSVTVTNAGGCSAMTTVYLTINPIPTASITPSNLTVCQGQPASLTASGGSTYLWNTGETTAVISVTATGVYSVTVSGETGPTGNPGARRAAAEGCSAVASSTVTVNPRPINASLTSGTLSCAQTSVTLTASATGGTSYTLTGGAGTQGNTTGQFLVSQPGGYTVTIANASGCTAMASASVSQDNTLPSVSIAANPSLTITLGQSATLTAQGATTYHWSTNENTSSIVVNTAGPYSVTGTGTNGCSSATSFTLSTVNNAPVATANASQTATVGMAFSYLVNAFTDAETPTMLTYTASINPANGFSFDPATRIISGTPSMSGVSSVSIKATDPGSLSASTTFTITVSPAFGSGALSVLHQDVSFGQTTTNTILPYLQLVNSGSAPIAYSAITVRYWLTVEGNSPITNFQNYYVQIGGNNVHEQYVPLATPRQGATAYVEYRFDAAAGSLVGGTNSGPIQNGFSKGDYSAFNQSDDYSYVANRDYVANARITAYVNGVLVYGQEPPVGARLGVTESKETLGVQVLGNPLVNEVVEVTVSGAGGQSLLYQLTDGRGHLVGEQRVEQAGSPDHQRLSVVGQPAGVLLLRVSSGTQSQTVKVLKGE